MLVKNGKIVCYRNPNDVARRKAPNPVYYPESMRQGRPTEELDIPVIRSEMVYGTNAESDAVAEGSRDEDNYDELVRTRASSHDSADAIETCMVERKPSVTIEIEGASDEVIEDDTFRITISATPSICRSSDTLDVSRANSDVSINSQPGADNEAWMPHGHRGLKKRQPSLLQRLFSKKHSQKDHLAVGGLAKTSSSESSLTNHGGGSDQEVSSMRQTMHDYDFKSLRQKFSLSHSRHSNSVMDNKRGTNSLLATGLGEMTKASSETCIGKRNKEEMRKMEKRDKKSRHTRKHGTNHDANGDDSFRNSDWLLEEFIQRRDGASSRKLLRCPSIEKLDGHHSKPVSRRRCQSQKVKPRRSAGSFQRHSISDITEACAIVTEDLVPSFTTDAADAVFAAPELRHMTEVSLWRSASDPCLTFEKIKEKAVQRAHTKNWCNHKKVTKKKTDKKPEPKQHKYHDTYLSAGGIELETSSGVFCSPHISDDEFEVVDVTVEMCAFQKRKNTGTGTVHKH